MSSNNTGSSREHVYQPTWSPQLPGMISVRAVVNGMPTEVQPSPEDPLLSTVELALRQTGNEGRPASEWTVTDDSGRPLDPARNARDLELKNFGTLFIQVEAGAGG